MPSPFPTRPAASGRNTKRNQALITWGVPLVVLLGFFVRFLVTPGRHEVAAFPLWEAAQWAFSAFLVVMMLRPLVSGEAWPHWRVFKQFHPLVAVQCALLVAATLGMALLLYAVLPFLNWSWLYLMPGEGNKAINIGLLPVRLPIIGPVFCVLFACNIPLLAHREEVDFRRNTRDWKQAVRRSIRFGLVHCFVGVPLFAGLALILSGLWYSKQYFEGGVERSTLHHATYNLIVLCVVAASLIFGWF